MRADKSKWEKVKLGEVCEVISGATPKTNVAEYWSDYGHLWITPAELDGTKYIGSTARHITDFALQHTHLTEMPIGTVLLSSRAPIGKVAITTETMYCNQGFKNLVCSKSVNNEFLYFYLTSQHERLNYLGNGVTFKEISKKTVSDFPILLPPLSEQQAIAEELDGIQSIIGKCREQLEDYDRLARSVFHEMFGDPVKNDKGWEVKKLTDFLQLLNGRAYSQKELLSKGKYRVLRVGNLSSTKDYYYSDLELAEDKYIDFGDLIYCWSCTFGAYIWKGEKVIYHYHIWKVILDDNQIDKEFARFILNEMTEYMSKQKHGVGMQHFTKGSMESNYFPLPPLPLQQQFAARIEAIEAMKEATKAQLADLQQLFDSRMQYYFS